ncbi:MAG: DUF547 domain-containing protein [Betaproteobacteria bacterium HGW-Betaproteobacteria-10]|nr:MAG: DUF547 domain-containing protein [Betaproteobacteria bacterium HGW-Betaproteobacteria-10]
MKQVALLAVFALTSLSASAFDHDYREWNTLLAKHVKVAPDGNSSRVDYRGMATDQVQLKSWLKTVSAVPEAEYKQWPKAQRLAFLINGYNAWTVELVLSKYPDLKSIKDIGSVFQSPWKKKFIPLFGQEIALDDIEHGLIRAPGAFDDPRIHAAVVCASIGCPMLRAEAFMADKLDSQLEDGMRRFLADSSRNRFDPASGKLQVSKIFDWYGKDFEKGHQGFTSLKATFGRYAGQLARTPEAQERIRQGDYKLEFLDYDWRLNDNASSGRR